MSLTQDLISLIRAKSVSDADLDAAALFTLDALANAVAGRNTRQGRMLMQWAARQAQDAGRLAFITGGMTHVLETDDLHRASVTHPGCVVVPAALAVAQREHADGADFLRAVLHGFEAMCRVGNAVGSEHYRIWHNTATCGPFGSAMATATLLQLDEQQALDALGNAGTQSSGLWQFLETGAMSKHLHAGRAAESGIIAADLAALGFSGPPRILEGEKGFFAGACPDAQPSAVLARPAEAWQLRQTSIKPWPCCRHTHPAIDAALALHKRHTGAAIVDIEIDTYQAALDVCDRPGPQSRYEAKFSLQHCVAVALQDGKVDFDSFDVSARERTSALSGVVRLRATEPWTSSYPESWGAIVTVNTADGEATSEARKGARGDPEHALSREEMKAKANMLMTYGGCAGDEARHLTEAILKVAEASSPVAEFDTLCNLMRAA